MPNAVEFMRRRYDAPKQVEDSGGSGRDDNLASDPLKDFQIVSHLLRLGREGQKHLLLGGLLGVLGVNQSTADIVNPVTYRSQKIGLGRQG